MRVSGRRGVGLLLCLPLAAGALGLSAGAASAAKTADDPARGLHYQGLEQASSGPCAGKFHLKGPANGGPARCSHGPDPAPAGVDVRAERAPETAGETA